MNSSGKCLDLKDSIKYGFENTETYKHLVNLMELKNGKPLFATAYFESEYDQENIFKEYEYFQLNYRISEVNDVSRTPKENHE